MGMENEICSNCKGLIRKGPTVKTADGKPFTMKYCPCTDELNAIWTKKMTTTPTETRRNATMRHYYGQDTPLNYTLDKTTFKYECGYCGHKTKTINGIRLHTQRQILKENTNAAPGGH